MDLIKTEDGMVTALSLVRTIRVLSHADLGRDVGVDAETILRWERGERLPSRAMAKRLGLLLRWPWLDFLAVEPMSYKVAQAQLAAARKAQGSYRAARQA